MIVLENLTKEFRLQGRKVTVFKNANAMIPTGKSVGVLGRNGAGKSTLLNMIGGTAVARSRSPWAFQARSTPT